MVHEWYQCYCLVSSVKVIVTEHVLRMQTKFYRACSTQSMKRYLRKRREWIRNIFWSGVSNTLLCLKPYVRISVVRWFLMLQSLRVWLCCGGNVGRAAGPQEFRGVTWPSVFCLSCTRPFVQSGERWRGCAGCSAPCLAAGAGGWLTGLWVAVLLPSCSVALAMKMQVRGCRVGSPAPSSGYP